MAIKWMVPAAALIGLLVAFALASWVGKAPEGTDRRKYPATSGKAHLHF